ncbi:MAG TPA: metallophosphoesterase, partial [Nitrospira sp.]
ECSGGGTKGSLSENVATIAIGDVHGNRAALDDLLDRLEAELDAGDTVVFLGDYIDRGPDSKGCIDSILRFRTKTQATVVTPLGNHEDGLLRTLEHPHRYSWLTVMQGLATVRSYSADAADVLASALESAGPRLVLDRVALPYEAFLDAMPPEHLAFFKGLKPFCRTADCVCVHGGLDPRRGPAEQQTRQTMICGASTFLTDYIGPDLVVHGHWDNSTPDARGWPVPAFGPASIGIDTISHGVLTALRLPDRRVFQSDRFT